MHNWYLLLFTLMSIWHGSASGQTEGEDFKPLCHVTVPSTVQVGGNTWNHMQLPAADDLDIYMVNKTGCAYGAAIWSHGDKFLDDAIFDGAVYEWRGAVRAERAACVVVELAEESRDPEKDESGYSFCMGYMQNKITYVNQLAPSLQLPKLSTPELLSRDHYVSLYLRLETGRITFRTECDAQLVFTHNVTVARGDSVRMQFQTFSEYGGKFLYNCPNIPGISIKNTEPHRSYPRKNTITSICNVTVPSIVEVNGEIWKKGETPAVDDLDEYMVNRTGRKYWAGKFGDWLDLPEMSFAGAVYEWHGAVRAKDSASFVVSWGEDESYSFFTGQLENTITNVFQRAQSLKLWEQSTPGILTPERFIPFYLRLESGNLTLGTECDRRVVFTHAVSVARGDQVKLGFQSFSHYGGKLLYAPPVTRARNDDYTSICNVTVPNTIEVQNNIWKNFELPEEDILDRYLVQKTGCQYWAGRCRAELRTGAAQFDGVMYQWRGAVRAGDISLLQIKWGEMKGFNVRVGDFYNSVTTVTDISIGDYLVEPVLRTQDILSQDRYVSLYLKLEPGIFTFGTECNTTTVFTHNATVARGDPVEVMFDSNSFYGGKILYSCPDVADPL